MLLIYTDNDTSNVTVPAIPSLFLSPFSSPLSEGESFEPPYRDSFDNLESVFR